MPPGDYRVTAELAGFRTGRADGWPRTVGALLEADFDARAREPGAGRHRAPNALTVNPSQTTIASVVSRQQIENLPVNGRRFVSFAALTPGVTRAAAIEVGSENSGLSFIGQRPVSNNLLVDGLDNNDRITGGANVSFGQEGVREFQVITSSYPAEFGNATGGIVNIVTKSGSNTPSGSAFGFFRDDALNARDYFERFDPFGTPLTQDKAPFRAGAVRWLAGCPAAARSHVPVHVRGAYRRHRQQFRQHRSSGGGCPQRLRVSGRDRTCAV